MVEAYDYQKLLKEKAEENSKFREALDKLRKQREEVVGSEVGLKVIGNVEIGRPTLGGGKYVENFRILRMIALRWNLSKILGEKATDGVVYSIGTQLGSDIVKKGIIRGETIEEFLSNVAEILKTWKIGILSVIETERNDMPSRIRVDECISCAGMLNVGTPVCHYEGGIIAGVLSEFLGKSLVAEEQKCWGQGDETCEFQLYRKS